MITPTEQERIKLIRDVFMENAVTMFGIEIDSNHEMHAQFVGANMATLDALFAIREGDPWRGITDPQEIAREVLRMGKIGDDPNDPNQPFFNPGGDDPA